MRHRRRTHYLGRKLTARVALLRGLVDSLVEHGRIRTTVAKAKELRRHVERAITVGKRGDLNARRLLLSRFPNEKTVTSIIGDLAPRFKSRPGGYTRIMRVGARPGDQAEMALIEFVDYEPGTTSQKKAEKQVEGSKKKSASKDQVKAKRTAARLAQRKRKRLRTLQRTARIEARV